MLSDIEILFSTENKNNDNNNNNTNNNNTNNNNYSNNNNMCLCMIKYTMFVYMTI